MAFITMLIIAKFLEAHMSIEMGRDDTIRVMACSHNGISKISKRVTATYDNMGSLVK